MSYQVLARKYRPRVLADVVGQEVLVSVISNAIESDRIHHAFLLTGTRGVGKTTTARIIALSLNCSADGNNGPTIHPCLQCGDCKQILNGSHPDVMEFDAASRTGVDSMREIIDSCLYPPMSARYKIYIIDEVHMLSKAAFNALLKTLEEPSEKVKFIFATTELRKVPMTIISRCQKFVLNNVGGDKLANHLANICSKEGVKYEAGVLDFLVKAADGSVRDALSLLDQAIAMSSDRMIRFNDAKKMLALPDLSDVLEILDCVLGGDVVGALRVVERVSSGSKDISEILYLLLNLVSQATVYAVNKKDLDIDLAALLKKHQNAANVANMVRLQQIIIQSIDEMKIVGSNLILEMLCIKMSYVASLPTVAEVLDLALEAGKS